MQHKFSYTGTPIRFCNIDVQFGIYELNVIIAGYGPFNIFFSNTSTPFRLCDINVVLM